MELISEYPQKQVIDHTFRFVNGESYTVTMDVAEDQVKELGNTFELHFAGGERATIYKRNLLLYSHVSRLVTVYPPGQSPTEQAIKSLDRTQPRVKGEQ